MRREQRVADRLYTHLFPRPGPSDPPNFNAHLNMNLVAEVRIETQRFYGGLETVEARYPGLNYTHPPHIKRLSYFPHHARLFQTFKELGLTHNEILTLCRWEGTLWARQRYEKDEGVKVEDTTGTEIKPWQPQIKKEVEVEQKVAGRRTSRPVVRRSHTSSQRVQQQNAASIASQSTPLVQVTTQEVPAPTASDVEMRDEPDAASSQGSTEGSAPTALPTDAFQRMQALARLRAQGESIDAMDPDFEQYLKDTAEASTSSSQGMLSLGELSDYQAAQQTIASVMSTVAQSHGAASSDTTSGASSELDVL
ncbi:hypothetical protein NA57DRAFT_54652 [Rhizodiscina lignyota]|uniref:Uncharacterized protein n=1 Tax=Rhizodiscina lignyota TaxID=1504668 RepID=A0A9P4M7L8_9PEZI|nr:hypothetical protein NA57DRAFT_54652 [Rhizodiscina lignyota]